MCTAVPSIAESGDVVRARTGPQSGLPGQRSTTPKVDQSIYPGQQSSHLLRAQISVIGASKKKCRRKITSVPLGKARVVREGRDFEHHYLWLLWSYTALEAAETLSKEGIDIEVVDLRTISPLDREAIAESVRKTSKVIVLHEHSRTGGPRRRNRCHHQLKKFSTISTAPSCASPPRILPCRSRRRRRNTSCPS